MAKRVTIQMVAERAGVSRGTVDRVLNDRPHVKKEQHDRVLAAMKELGYEPIHREQAEKLGIRVSTPSILRLGAILPNRNEYYMSELRRGIRDAQAQFADLSVEILTDQIEDAVPEEIEAKIDGLLAQNVRGIALSAPNQDRIIQKINALSQKGIPVVTFETDVPESRRICFYGQNLERVGRVAGGLMFPFLKAGDQVVAAVGSREIGEHRVRLEGFREALVSRGFPEQDILSIETYNDYQVTYEKLYGLLREGRCIRGVYMCNHSLNGCIDAISAAAPDHRVHVISNDVTRAAVRFLKKGSLDFCVTPNIYLQGYQPMVILEEYLMQHREPRMSEIHSSTEILTTENLSLG